MTRNEAISTAFEIKENGVGNHDISGLLYSAVGMIKLSPDSGTALAAHILVEEIRKAVPNLSDFCQRKVDIIEKHYIQKMGKMMETYVDAMARLDAERDRRILCGR